MESSGKQSGSRWAGALMSAGFYLYALGLAPLLARALKAGLGEGEAPWLAGGIVLAVVVLEPFGLRWKLQYLRRRIREEGLAPPEGGLGLFSAVGIGHMIVTMFLGMLVVDGWGGLGEGGGEASGPWVPVVLTGLVLKEFAELLAAGGQSEARDAPGHGKERLADLLLAAYGAVAYTAWWGVIVDLEEAGSGTVGARLALLPVFLAIFLFFYLPMRLPFLLEEYHLRSVAGRKARIGMELGVGAALGLYPFLF